MHVHVYCVGLATVNRVQRAAYSGQCTADSVQQTAYSQQVSAALRIRVCPIQAFEGLVQDNGLHRGAIAV